MIIRNKIPFVVVTKNSWKIRMYVKDKMGVRARYRKPYFVLKKIDYRYFINVYERLDIAYEINKMKLKCMIVLKERTKLDCVSFVLETDLKVWLDKKGKIVVCDEDKMIYFFDKLRLYDGRNASSSNVFYEIEKCVKGYEIIVKFDKSWVNSGDRKYPVVISN